MPPNVADVTAETFRELTRERRWLSELDADILRTQIDVAQIAAPTGAERRRARWVAQRLREIGLSASIDDAGNVVSRAPGAYAGAPVVVCAHLDTVFPKGTSLDVRREESRLVGPGICDNGRGLAVMLVLARMIRHCNAAFARAIEFVATTGEEGAGDLRGAKYHFAKGPPPFAVIALDGAGDERIVNTALGSRRFRIVYRGPGGHSWAAFGTPNTLHAAARATTRLANLRLGNGGRSALTVSRIGGGMSINAIPEEAWLEVDARSTSHAALVQLEREIRSIAAAAALEENDRRSAANVSMTVVVERIGDRPSGRTDEDSALVTAAIEATRLVGRTAELATASTDANAAIAAGTPAIAIGGGGRGGDAHTSREWFDNTSSTAGVERALTIVATMARLAAD